VPGGMLKAAWLDGETKPRRLLAGFGPITACAPRPEQLCDALGCVHGPQARVPTGLLRRWRWSSLQFLEQQIGQNLDQEMAPVLLKSAPGCSPSGLAEVPGFWEVDFSANRSLCRKSAPTAATFPSEKWSPPSWVGCMPRRTRRSAGRELQPPLPPKG